MNLVEYNESAVITRTEQNGTVENTKYFPRQKKDEDLRACRPPA